MENIQIVDKKGKIIGTADKKLDHLKFLKLIKKFNHIRVGVGGGKKPFEYIFLKVDKKEVIQSVMMSQMEVTCSIMYNSRVQKNLEDTLYISKMRTTLFDKK